MSCGLCQPHWVEVNLIRRLAIKALMPPSAVVEREVPTQATSSLPGILVGLEIDLLVFHAAPQTFDEHVVHPAPASVHTDLDLFALEHAREGRARELAALICIEYLRRAVMGDGGFERINTEIIVHRVRHTPRQDLA